VQNEFRLAGSLRHLPWARGWFRRARVIRDRSARKNDEEHEERSVHQRTKHQNGACRDHGHFFRSLGFVLLYVRACTIYLFFFCSFLFFFLTVVYVRPRPVLRYTSTRGEARAHHSFSWGFTGKWREMKTRKKTNNACTESQILTVSLSLSPTFPLCFLSKEPKSRLLDVTICAFCFFF